MKVQCSCGAKYSFEITPEMRTNPVRFLCVACGLDASEFVDGLIREELGQNITPHGRVITVEARPEEPITRARVTSAAEAPVGVAGLPADPRGRIGAGKTPASASAVPLRVNLPPPRAETIELEQSDSEEGARCPKHPAHSATKKCYICSKPICPKCMELFGYVCSPLCKAKADSHGIDVPIYEGQRSFKQARMGRRIAWSAGAVGAVVAALLGFWFWYAWFGSAPRVAFSMR